MAILFTCFKPDYLRWSDHPLMFKDSVDRALTNVPTLAVGDAKGKLPTGKLR
jgi:hypothetical protein